jgi:hypothetical protein
MLLPGLLQPMHVLLLMAIVLLLAGAVTFALRDAKRRGKSPVAVILLVLSVFPLGLAIWLVFRPEPVTAEYNRQ